LAKCAHDNRPLIIANVLLLNRDILQEAQELALELVKDVDPIIARYFTHYYAIEVLIVIQPAKCSVMDAFSEFVSLIRSLIFKSCKEDDADEMMCIDRHPFLKELWEKAMYDFVEHDLAGRLRVKLPHLS
jgi:hypothetical protein